ncbi:hypothetical protein [Bartonella apis]|uniref:hypothetical protein n=1 Tax=Bartonella apis TaxID=1686310 RepID=UPI0024333673|nr:hypothetical protein [Bartonella apis]
MTNKNNEELREGWYWSWNGRDFFVNDGAFPTRGAVADFVNAKSFKGKEKPAQIYLVYGKEIDLKIADYISNIVERVNEDLPDMQDVCGDGPFYCSFDEKISLDKMVKEAADRWQIYNGIRPVYVRFRKDTIQTIPLEPAK